MAPGEEEIEGDEIVQEFRYRNEAYESWLAEHPHGFVLNIGMIDASTPDPEDQVVHTARCGHVHGRGRDWTGACL